MVWPASMPSRPSRYSGKISRVPVRSEMEKFFGASSIRSMSPWSTPMGRRQGCSMVLMPGKRGGRAGGGRDSGEMGAEGDKLLAQQAEFLLQPGHGRLQLLDARCH